MPVSEADIKILWGRAAGVCSRPGCDADLTRLVEGGRNYNVGEMAHVIARSVDGPRGGGSAGADTYENLILLCPTCHRDVDKAPEGLFPAELILEWKAGHENRVRALGSEIEYSSVEGLKSAVGLLLAENHQVWKTLGPNSEIATSSPASNAHDLWEMRRIDKIVPNNRKIINIVGANAVLLDQEQREAFAEFVNHAESYEDHVYDRRDHYPLFPEAFGRIFR